MSFDRKHHSVVLPDQVIVLLQQAYARLRTVTRKASKAVPAMVNNKLF